MPELNQVPSFEKKEPITLDEKNVAAQIDQLFDDVGGEEAIVTYEGIDMGQANYQGAVEEKMHQKKEMSELKERIDRIVLNASTQIRDKRRAMGWEESMVEDVIGQFAREAHAMSMDTAMSSVPKGTDWLYQQMMQEIERREAADAITH